MKKKINIEGMSCMHCVRHIKEALSEIKGISNIEVNLQDKYAVCDVDNVDNKDIVEKIEEFGYSVVSIEEL
ncbi:heavy metal-associated domain-containing protein [Caloramator sp. mosi_1]|uniref:heavy-metal-associated domain-containing protein n=1 Tax=Caloramator sp. mosi_1 TaxID=3023090 RepID=UPI00235E1DC2|nr:heavy metal-associated domain-containing protein [Caloramator sp. mosi_1]WDC85427.1 heavy metal-associated domain-containing protein [Caloramator sp. mosi_1]